MKCISCNGDISEYAKGIDKCVWCEEELCVHGMSAWLCMGPNHYPTMQDEMKGRYF